MRKVNVGMDRFTKVIAMDEPGPGNASHKYGICRKETLEGSDCEDECGRIEFQHGPIKLNGVNGCHNEDLLAIVIDRLQGFQSSSLSCRENALALTKLEEALHWLNHRTNDRIRRDVEGTNEK